jgi:hypothetical protein
MCKAKTDRDTSETIYMKLTDPASKKSAIILLNSTALSSNRI